MSTEVTPYETEGSKKEQVTKMFDGIAPYYDLLNMVLSLGVDRIWRRKAIAMLKGSSITTLLDVATGTADLAVEANKQLPEAKITAVDISSKMIELAKKKIAKKGLTDKITARVADSEVLPFEDNSFDALTVAFGVRNYGDLDKGLSEMRRVLNKGGKLMILEFSKPTMFPFKQLFNGYFKYILPTISRFKADDPEAYKYLYKSVQAFPDYDRFDDILKRNGFINTKWKALTLGICTIYTGSK